jgi:hypothetical protein
MGIFQQLTDPSSKLFGARGTMGPMSTGLFMGVRSSYIDGAEASAEAFLAAINRALTHRGAASYLDPPEAPNVYNGHLFGRSELDHHTSRVLSEIARVGTQSRENPNLALIRDNPYRVAFVPADFAPPTPTEYYEQIGDEDTQIWVGSLPRLLTELKHLAGQLGIPLVNGELADETASAINEFKPFRNGDSVELIEDERTAWLALYEGARLAVEHRVALTLAG